MLSKTTSSSAGVPKIPTDQTVDRAANTKLRLEHYYKVAVEHAVERNSRYVDTLWICSTLDSP